jgi:hypothetical protein
MIKAKPSMGQLLLVGCCTLALVLPYARGAQQTDKTEFLRKARQAYYSLRNEGLSGVQCSVANNWDYQLAEARKSNPEQIDEAIKRFQTLHFSVSVDSDGKATVMHNDLPAQNEQAANALKQVYGGIEQMVTGFFQTWSAYMITPALPEVGSDFQLEELPAAYRISYKETSTDITTILGRDFAISSQRVVTPEFDTTLKPQLTKIAKGFILSGYQASYRSGSPNDATDLQVGIDYQELSGLQFPQKVKLTGSYGGTPIQAEFSFVGCQATKQ